MRVFIVTSGGCDKEGHSATVRHPTIIRSAKSHGIYTSVFVRSHLEYCAQTWATHLRRDVDEHEMVQCLVT